MEYSNGWYEHTESVARSTMAVVPMPPVQRAPAMDLSGTGARLEATCSPKAMIEAGTASWFVLLDLGVGSRGQVVPTAVYRAYRVTAGAAADARLDLTIAWPR